MNGRLTRRGFIALAGGLVLGGAAAGTALAQQAPWPSGACPMGSGDAGQPGSGPAAGRAGAPHEAIATALGMTVEELFAAQRSGKTITQIAQERGIDLGTVVAAALGAHKQALDSQVQAGQLTQGQADQMQAHMEANIRAHMAGQTGHGMWGGPGFSMPGAGMGPGMGPGMMPGMGPGMMPGHHGPGMMPGMAPGHHGPGMMPGFGPR